VAVHATLDDRFVVLEYNASKDTFYWIAVHAKEQLIVDKALQRPFKLSNLRLIASNIISKVYRVDCTSSLHRMPCEVHRLSCSSVAHLVRLDIQHTYIVAFYDSKDG
jgi:hypothetical protein